MDRIYLDYASTTPLDPRVEAAMKPYFNTHFGNPSSLHREGQLAMAALDKSRETIANLIGAKFNEIIFTSSATEANNLALRGIAARIKNLEYRKNSKFYSLNSNFNPRIIVSSIEHESVLETVKDLEKDGVEVIYLPVNRQGLVDVKKLESSLDKNTVLVSIIYANNETGAMQDLRKISQIVRNARNVGIVRDEQAQRSGKRSNPTTRTFPLLHTDAVQAFQYLDCNVDSLGVDLMTLSSHKIYGPKGAGALYVRTLDQKRLTHKSQMLVVSGQLLSPQATGGGQEFELRSGTENVPAIVGFAKAAEIAYQIREKECERVRNVRDYLWTSLKKVVKSIQLNGDLKGLPNILNVYFRGMRSEEILIKLDLNGMAVSAGSACASRSLEASHVLLAMGLAEARAKGSIRFALGRNTTQKEIDSVLIKLKSIV